MLSEVEKNVLFFEIPRQTADKKRHLRFVQTKKVLVGMMLPKKKKKILFFCFLKVYRLPCTNNTVLGSSTVRSSFNASTTIKPYEIFDDILN